METTNERITHFIRRKQIIPISDTKRNIISQFGLGAWRKFSAAFENGEFPDLEKRTVISATGQIRVYAAKDTPKNTPYYTRFKDARYINNHYTSSDIILLFRTIHTLIRNKASEFTFTYVSVKTGKKVTSHPTFVFLTKREVTDFITSDMMPVFEMIRSYKYCKGTPAHPDDAYRINNIQIPPEPPFEILQDPGLLFEYYTDQSGETYYQFEM